MWAFCSFFWKCTIHNLFPCSWSVSHERQKKAFPCHVRNIFPYMCFAVHAWNPLLRMKLYFFSAYLLRPWRSLKKELLMVLEVAKFCKWRKLESFCFFSGDSADGKLGKAEGGNGSSADNKSSAEEENGIGILETMLDNLDQFVVEPSPQGCIVKCRITRDRKGMDRGSKLLLFKNLCKKKRPIVFLLSSSSKSLGSFDTRLSRRQAHFWSSVAHFWFNAVCHAKALPFSSLEWFLAPSFWKEKQSWLLFMNNEWQSCLSIDIPNDMCHKQFIIKEGSSWSAISPSIRGIKRGASQGLFLLPKYRVSH